MGARTTLSVTGLLLFGTITSLFAKIGIPLCAIPFIYLVGQWCPRWTRLLCIGVLWCYVESAASLGLISPWIESCNTEWCNAVLLSGSLNFPWGCRICKFIVNDVCSASQLLKSVCNCCWGREVCFFVLVDEWCLWQEMMHRRNEGMSWGLWRAE